MKTGKVIAYVMSVLMITAAAGAGYDRSYSTVNTVVSAASDVIESGDFLFSVAEDSEGKEKVLLKEYKGNSSVVEIPAEVEGKTVTAIGEYAFSKTRIKEVSIPESVTEIEEGAFYFCVNLESFTLPVGVSKLGPAVLAGCESLKFIDVEEGNKNYKTDDGILYSADGTELIVYPGGKEDTDYIISDSVTKISGAAFAGNSNIKSVVMPDTVTETEGGIFAYCHKLESVKLSDSLSELPFLYLYNYVADWVGYFEECYKLTNVEFPSELKKIGPYCFTGCNSITEFYVPDSVTDIEIGAFSDNTGITDITLGKSVKNMNYSAFENSTNLQDIHVDTENPVYSEIDGVLFDKSGRELVCYPVGKTGSYKVPSGTENIGYASFYKNTNIEKIIIPESVKYIGSYAFNGCRTLSDVVFESENPSDNILLGRYPFYRSEYQNKNTDESGLCITEEGFLLDIPDAEETEEIRIPAEAKLTAACLFQSANPVVFEGSIHFSPDTFYWSEVKNVTVTGDCTIEDRAFGEGSKIENLEVKGTLKCGQPIFSRVNSVKYQRKELQYDISDNTENYINIAERKTVSGEKFISEPVLCQASDKSIYSAAGSEGKVTVFSSSGKIFSAEREGFTFGAACMDDSDNIYFMWGRSISDEELEGKQADEFINIYVDKYDISGKKKAELALPLSDTEAQFPFDAGNASMVYHDREVCLVFDTEWLRSSDGYHHQGSDVVIIDSETMTPTLIDTLNVSHSFGISMIPTDYGFANIQRGDANLRGINFCVYSASSHKMAYDYYALSRIVAFHSPGRYGTNEQQLDGNMTYINLGGLAKSESTYAIAGTAEKNYTTDYFWDSEYRTKKYNVFVRILDQTANIDAAADCAGEERINLATGETADTNVVWLTSLEENEYAKNVKVVTLESGAYCVMWEEYLNTDYFTPSKSDVYYVILDEKGNVIRNKTKIHGANLSDDYISPVVTEGNILSWTALESEESIGFYSVNLGLLEKKPAPSYGDVNCDGKIDVTDLTLLSLYLIGDRSLEGESLENADTDGDGQVKLTDLANLRMYISRIKDKLGPEM